jgi:hypothetical protein
VHRILHDALAFKEGASKAMLRELAQLLREQRNELKGIGGGR